jgi:hypothetical protein
MKLLVGYDPTVETIWRSLKVILKHSELASLEMD